MSLARYTPYPAPRLPVPAPPAEYAAEYSRLDGGLNLQELDYRMEKNQSPDSLNLLWQDGVLSCRDGQTACDGLDAPCAEPGPGKGLAAAETLFHGHLFCHLGTALYCAPEGEALTFALAPLDTGLPAVRGTFFCYDGALFYKTRGYYRRIAYREGGTPLFTAEDVAPYVPVTLINAAPGTGAGDLYQPENRLSPDKTVWFTAAELPRSESFAGDGSRKAFSLTNAAGDEITAVRAVYVGGTLLYDEQYAAAQASGVWTVTLAAVPASGAWVLIEYAAGERVYRLPAQELEAVVSVTVDGAARTAGTDYTADLAAGTVAFSSAPPAHDPGRANTVAITYRKPNEAARAAVMDCRYACVYGGGTDVLVVLAGSAAQPNAYFWSGSHAAMDAGYFPLPQYNLAGDPGDPVTGFGVQNGYLMIFKERSVARSQVGTRTVSGRAYPTLDCTNVNNRTGCDLPWTIRLVENNLVFCNTAEGVFAVRDTTPALENNLLCLSRAVNGSAARPGLLRDLRAAEKDAACCGFDGERYWLSAGGEAWVWDCRLSGQEKPCWFRCAPVAAAAFVRSDRGFYHLNGAGRLTRFERTFADYGGGIEKRYRFAAEHFSSYGRRWDVRRAVFVVRADTDTEIAVRYLTDHETRLDRTPIRCYSWRLAPRNLGFRSLAVTRFAHAELRRPGCRQVRHFAMELSNGDAYRDMALVAARVEFVSQGRER